MVASTLSGVGASGKPGAVQCCAKAPNVIMMVPRVIVAARMSKLLVVDVHIGRIRCCCERKASETMLSWVRGH
jgi:hypothetical protein